jgi:hypothetical protein
MRQNISPAASSTTGPDSMRGKRGLSDFGILAVQLSQRPLDRERRPRALGDGR